MVELIKEMKNLMFNAEKVRDEIIDWLKQYAKESNFHKVVIGISGGKDSTVTAALCARALGKQNVYGVLLPDGIQDDIDDSYKVCETLGIPYTIINIDEMHDSLKNGIILSLDHNHNMSIPFSEEADINVAPRLRMTVLRYITQALGARLVGTGNLSEITVGYFTKDGDQSCDFSLLGDLTSLEVVQIGLSMPEIPAHLVTKTPSDGLCGLSDEEKLGISYKDIHEYIRNNHVLLREKRKIYDRIYKMWVNSLHKINKPETYELGWKNIEDFYG